MKQFWTDDPDDLKDKELQQEDQPTSPEQATQKIDLAGLSDEALVTELAKRKVLKLNQRIAELQSEILALQKEHKRLQESPTAVLLTPTATNVNPITGKVKGQASPGPCDCVSGCYKCIKE